MQGVFAIFGIPDGLPIIGGIGDFHGRLVGILIPKSGQFGEFTSLAIMISHLLLGDQAEPTAKPALALSHIHISEPTRQRRSSYAVN